MRTSGQKSFAAAFNGSLEVIEAGDAATSLHLFASRFEVDFLEMRLSVVRFLSEQSGS